CCSVGLPWLASSLGFLAGRCPRSPAPLPAAAGGDERGSGRAEPARSPVIPTKLPRFTAILDLSHNNLTRLRADWTPTRLPHLHSLLLNHNALGFISTEAFCHVPHLRYLDLSSNSIKVLEELLFSQLQELELVKDRAKLPDLALLDLSANKIKGLPVAALKGLPAWMKNGLYLHSNPLSCDCGLYELFTHWHARQLSSVVDFREELVCSLPLAKRSVSVFTLNSQDSLNCSEFKEHMLETYLGDTLTINCDTKVRGATTREWVTPNNRRFPEETANSTMTVLSNGSLQIRLVRVEDMGTYTCYTVSQAFNETLYVDVMVHNFTQHGPHDTLNTAYTTLVGCILSVILVLIYLTTPNHNPEAAGRKGSLSHLSWGWGQGVASERPHAAMLGQSFLTAQGTSQVCF
uniref:Adhesion molecule with Ig like domain 1 n=1 Tax=Gopherus evgoodei TaxID=1825980 RepID=A0A8C4W656_9SAUR